MKKLILGVCEGRHEMPCKNFIFGQEIDQKWLVNPKMLEELAFWHLCENLEDAGLLSWRQQPDPENYGSDIAVNYAATGTELVIYVTGLTVAVFATVNAAKALEFAKITLMHFDRESGQYYPQLVR